MGIETAYEYQFEFKSTTGQTYLFELGVHWDNSIGEPRIAWRTADGSYSGGWGSLKYPEEHSRSSHTPMMTIEVVEPTLVFGRFEDGQLMLPDEVYDSITLPERIGGALRDELEALGTIRRGDSISDDPSAFPESITDPGLPYEPAEWKRLGWNREDRIMWYQLTNYPKPGSPEWDYQVVESPRPYQIDDGDLIWRKFHIVGTTGSPEELMDELELEDIP